MAIRNMEKVTKEACGHIPTKYNITISELDDLLEMIRQGGMSAAFEVVCKAFKYGFVCGHRATLAGKVDKKL